MFTLKSNFEPKGDQPHAIKKILEGFLDNGIKEQVLIGATGTGKTFTIANVIKRFFDNLNSKKNCVLYLVNNKSLVMQVFKEMQEFFPNDSIGCYVSYFGYYRPEAYKPSAGLYFEKKTQRIPEIIRMRQESIRYLFSDDNVIIVSSVAAIYGCLSPKSFESEMIKFSSKKKYLFTISELKESMNILSYNYLDIENDDFVNNESIFFKKMKIGNFYFCNKKLGFIPEWKKNCFFKIYFDYQSSSSRELNILKIEKFLVNFEEKKLFFSENLENLDIYPNSDYVKKAGEKLEEIIKKIENELSDCKKKFVSEEKFLEAERIEKRVKEDISNLREIGSCYGIENYSIYFDERDENSPPSTILDFFPEKFLTIIDESHMTIPQISAMYNTNFHRLKNLVENGFRLPSAFQNRPLYINEFFEKLNYVLYVSATPGKFEIERAKGALVEQVIRPTGILDPLIEVRSARGQINDIIDSIRKRIVLNQKVLIYALTIAMSEEISKYLEEKGFKVVYIHSKLEVFERHQIINSLRRGIYDVIVGINLLKEGIDLPEVSLVCILDADKPGFLRDTKSLIQIIGRASRNVNGMVFLYANEITHNMLNAIEETNRRRLIQSSYNRTNNLSPFPIIKPIRDIVSEDVRKILLNLNDDKEKKNIKSIIKKLKRRMVNYSKEFKFDEAISLRNVIHDLEEKKN